MIVNPSRSAIAVLCALLMIGAAVAPFAAVAQENEEPDDDLLEIEVEQEEDTVLVTVTYNGTPTENASVNVTGNDDEYVYNVSKFTDESGTVTFNAPEQDVEVTVSVGLTVNGELTTGTVNEELEGPSGLEVSIEQDADSSVTITVTDNWTAADGSNISVETVDEEANYSDAGEYDNVSEGILNLDAPAASVEVNVTADYEGKTTSVTTTLYNATDLQDESPFGLRVSTFVHELQNDSNVTRIGPLVAKFVVDNNPGNAPDHAGPPERFFDEAGNWSPGPPDHAGPKDGSEDDDRRGPPVGVGASADDDRGPPDHAGPK